MKTHHWKGGGIPYGYAYDKEKNVLVHVPPEVQILQKIFRLVIDGYGSKRIADKLNSENHKTRSGGNWSTATIDVMLLDSRLKFYMGYDPKSGKKGNWFPILLKSVYDRMPKHTKTTTPSKRMSNREDFLLSGNGNLFTCGYCGGNVKASVTIKSDKRILYYLCSRKQVQGKSQCPNSKLVRQEVIDSVVSTDLKVELSRISTIKKYIKELRELKQKELVSYLKEKNKKAIDIAQKERLTEIDFNSIRSAINMQETIEDFCYFFSEDIDPIPLKKKIKESILDNIYEIRLLNHKVVIEYNFPINEKLEFTKSFQLK